MVNCSIVNRKNPQNLVDEIAPRSSTVSSIIEKHGNPDRINEFDDKNSKHVILNYGENHFYFRIYENGSSFLISWFLESNFSEYSDLLSNNKLNKKDIRKMFGKGESEGFYQNSSYIEYNVNNGTLLFNFKDEKLISIVWRDEAGNWI